tara:strand:- start:214 stop:600 length:387 start_codon:yes stop_codon:yes gene_type:complete
MRLTIITLLLISNIGFSQTKSTELKFETKYYNAVDNWVAFPKKETDSTFAYGFIYIDQMAGITLRYGGKFKVEKNRFTSTKKETNSMIIHRLTKKTCFFSKSMYNHRISFFFCRSKSVFLNLKFSTIS